jgi:uncharacterized membrane protein
MAPTLIAALLLGFSAGLRSMTPLAVLAWLGPAQFVWLQGWLGKLVTTVFATGEIVSDKLPFTPARTKLGPLLGRLVIGAVVGYFIANHDKAGALLGAAAALAGTFGGYRARRALTQGLGIPDLLVAIVEDAAAVGLAVAATRV